MIIIVLVVVARHDSRYIHRTDVYRALLFHSLSQFTL